ncbi:hypothetical protein CLOM_g5181 [Closterium sp. NIES-68]|nr:hypothetical protein CLOM_g5181 [Closterium sp. NIES-68]GJP73636.1 hypothetical protein CLOP_g4331 [Closterium sp. NIES-67]
MVAGSADSGNGGRIGGGGGSAPASIASAAGAEITSGAGASRHRADSDERRGRSLQPRTQLAIVTGAAIAAAVLLRRRPSLNERLKQAAGAHAEIRRAQSRWQHHAAQQQAAGGHAAGGHSAGGHSAGGHSAGVYQQQEAEPCSRQQPHTGRDTSSEHSHRGPSSSSRAGVAGASAEAAGSAGVRSGEAVNQGATQQEREQGGKAWGEAGSRLGQDESRRVRGGEGGEDLGGGYTSDAAAGMRGGGGEEQRDREEGAGEGGPKGHAEREEERLREEARQRAADEEVRRQQDRFRRAFHRYQHASRTQHTFDWYWDGRSFGHGWDEREEQAREEEKRRGGGGGGGGGRGGRLWEEMEMVTDHWHALGLDSSRGHSIPTSEIKAAFRAKAMEHHPDRNQDNQERAAANFRRVLTAYEFLSSRGKHAARR